MINEVLTNGHWVCWLYFLVLYPFGLYDYIKQDKHRRRDTIGQVLLGLLGILYVCAYVFSPNLKKVDFHSFNLGFALLLLLIFLQCLNDMLNRRTKINVVKFSVLSIALAALLILQL